MRSPQPELDHPGWDPVCCLPTPSLWPFASPCGSQFPHLQSGGNDTSPQELFVMGIKWAPPSQRDWAEQQARGRSSLWGDSSHLRSVCSMPGRASSGSAGGRFAWPLTACMFIGQNKPIKPWSVHLWEIGLRILCGEMRRNQFLHMTWEQESILYQELRNF